ncbi:hypothetical protein ACM66B_002062 [Microbotryomycetes sp. NB124-2]
MSSLWQLCCGCLGGSNRYNDHGGVDEHTALLNPDIIPEAPARQPKQTTEEQAAQQEALRQILHKATERFVNIEAPAPFNRASPFSSRSASPNRSGPSSPPLVHDRTPDRSAQQQSRRIASWRPSFDDDDTYTDRQHRIKVVHLGPLFDVQGFANALQGTMALADSGVNKSRNAPLQSQPAAQRPMSAHSLRTLPRGPSGAFKSESKPSPLRNQGATRHDNQAGGDDDDDTDVEDDSEHDEHEQDTKYGTIASYKTARENRDSLISHEPISAELKKALAELEESVKSFKIDSVGPIVADLGQVAKQT